jgi:putative intracellular protease/amidase
MDGTAYPHYARTQYDIIYMAGGWGAAYDLGQSDELGKKVSEAYAQDKILGSVCHGALGFIKAVDEKGFPLVKGKRMTAVTDKQVRELGISITLEGYSSIHAKTVGGQEQLM